MTPERVGLMTQRVVGSSHPFHPACSGMSGLDLERAGPGADDDRVICRAPLLLLLVLASSGCGGKVGPNADPPQIVPWSAVGGVRIGLTADGVRRTWQHRGCGDQR